MVSYLKGKMNFSDFKEIQTNRLTLSLISKKDIDIVFALRSNIEVQKHIGREPYMQIKEAETQVKKVLDLFENQDSITWILNLNSESKKIGSICFWNFSQDRKTAEVGYDLLPEYHNKGIMNEALKAVLQFGFETLHLHAVEAYTSKHNVASKTLLGKNNFVLQSDREDEGFPDNLIFSLKRAI